MSLHSSKLLQVWTATEHRQIAAKSSTTTYVNYHIEAPACSEVERRPIDLVVVLDKSGSMAGQKLELCKQTMQFLSRELSSSDRVALVSYDSHVTLNLPLTKMDQGGKALLSQRVEAIHAGSCTNLSGGLIAGLDEVQEATRLDGEAPNPVQSVLLLTDGLANEGIVNKTALIRYVEKMLSKNVSLFTFGYGSDHDADILRQLSDLGQGAYYFVQNIDGVSIAFADCLGGLLSVVAQNIKVDIIAAPGVSIAAVKTKRRVDTIVAGTHVSVDLGDLYSEEARDLVVQLEVGPVMHCDVETLAEFRIRYTNVLTLTKDSSVTTCTVDRPVVVTDTTVDSGLIQQLQRIETAEAIEAAQCEANQGNLSGGTARLRALADKFRRNFADRGVDASVGQERALLDDLNDCCVAMANTHIYRERGQYRMASRAQTHYTQRSNDSEISWEVIREEDSTRTRTGQTSIGTYRNDAKRKIISRAFDTK
ncbi:hypothetical protein ACHHYP_17492 [Achlya hypogyna]|uniref:VWFA domain-containing protein n=1 Tax=Achlya hypogyna TaxID=1202772 RepID=A0A1V9Y487_ACHHY|nr:hypothetical protein ACHHYP_17492 [Achlya hypogyna]